ncbi:putative vacuolar (H+)-ATPase G subunit [Dioscorea sansibarensis]
MDAMRGQGGIQMLLRAEQEAQKIVTDARNLKMTKLKQAKDEAERDSAAYRSALEEEYQRKISKNTGSSGSNIKRLDEETELKIKRLNDATKQVHVDVIRMLIKQVITIKT